MGRFFACLNRVSPASGVSFRTCNGADRIGVCVDPTVFPKSGVILDQLYAGGYSAVVDASKFFYNFPTKPEERK
jgi:hypothetical protein